MLRAPGVRDQLLTLTREVSGRSGKNTGFRGPQPWFASRLCPSPSGCALGSQPQSPCLQNGLNHPTLLDCSDEMK